MKTAWSNDQIYLGLPAAQVLARADELYQLTFRTSFEKPGFCVVTPTDVTTSQQFRQLMVDLTSAFSEINQETLGDSLSYVSAMRFDQQTSTKPHLDSGPEQNVLMLGYEPTSISSTLSIFDYSQCAYENGLKPLEFLERYNPMFQTGYEQLKPFETVCDRFEPSRYQLVLINNSSSPYSDHHVAWQGTLHTASVPDPDESERRIINSTMIAPTRLISEDALSSSQLQDFVNTTVVHRRGYDKQHLVDDV